MVKEFVSLHEGLTSDPCGGHRAVNPTPKKSFKDETGLFALVCQHLMVVNSLAMYTGERFVNITVLLRELGILSPDALKDFILAYDLVCKLRPFLLVCFLVKSRLRKTFHGSTVS
jgi:hypothetical protein